MEDRSESWMRMFMEATQILLLMLKTKLMSKVKFFSIISNNANIELSQNEEDERYRYLLKNGIVRRVEDEDKIIFAELP